jgi:tRNA(Leu) C34 or U34 (ribose-2'-O)-methylase TrmL|tara:strand:+ start:2754 stop:3002 length:249 start_codon:yes stop_codon:yes gene_type:complete
LASSDLKRSVQNYIDTADNRLLKMIKALVESYHEEDQIVAYTVDGKPLTRKQYNQELVDAETEIQRGELTSVEDLEKESQNW